MLRVTAVIIDVGDGDAAFLCFSVYVYLGEDPRMTALCASAAILVVSSLTMLNWNCKQGRDA